MARKKKMEYHSYTEGNVRYLSCKVCGRYEKVGDEATAVKCGRCTHMSMVANYPDEDKSYKPTGRPVGWHWMTEFVDKDGNVFHRGKEQPKLKGTLPPTKVKPPKKRKVKRRTRDEVLVAHYKKKKSDLKKAVKKQKDFLNHNIKKG
jgi:hypothetical protein